MRLTNNSSLAFQHAWSIFLPILFIGPNARAASAIVQTCCSPRGTASAQYVTSQAKRDPLAKSGPTGVIIEASLPELYKSATLLGVRRE
jgi:hypothetical protein